MNTSARIGAFAAALVLLASANAPAAPPSHERPFGRGRAVFHKTEIAPYRFHNEIIKIVPDFEKNSIAAEVTNVIEPKNDGLQTIAFDSVGLNYSAVTVNGAAAKYHVADDKLLIDLDTPAKAGDVLTIVATYTATPVRGVYFNHPDSAYPNMQPEIWTQGESEDNRRWFPTWDEPNEKSPSEVVVTVKKGWLATANGALKAQTDNADGTTTFDWVESHPHSTYLTAFTAGPYVKHHTVAHLGDGRTVPVDYFVSAADSKWADLCFGRTNQMVEYFSKIIGVPYPWEKYDQTTVERFTAGGMENVTVTTQTELAIHPPEYDLESPCDGLVSHELAHQWWGDDVTTADWANIWINEGYATYFQELWYEHHFGEARFQFERWNAQQDYFDETKRYWRPIVNYSWEHPEDNFDSSGYPRPAQVLHMLRAMYGDQKFFKALHDYLLTYTYGNADTHQFFVAFGKSVGANLDWFENEWYHRAAYPHFYVKQQYDAAAHTLRLDVTQKNHDGQPFRAPIDVAVYTNGSGKTAHFTADRNHQTVTIAGVTSNPQMVLFDPNNIILRELDFEKSTPELGYQAMHAPYVGDRMWAVDQLGNAGKKDKALAAQLLGDVVQNDPFFGVRVEAVQNAAGLDEASAVLAGLKDGDKRVVIAAANAVDGMDHPNVPALVQALKALAATNDPMVASAALHGLGATKARGVYPILIAALDRHSFREFYARGALKGLAAYGDMRAVPFIKARTAYGIDEAERPDAINALARIAAKHPAMAESTLIAIVSHDPYFRARAAAAGALGKLGQTSSIAILDRVSANDSEVDVQNAAWDAVQNIHDKQKPAAKRVF